MSTDSSKSSENSEKNEKEALINQLPEEILEKVFSFTSQYK
jgi:hypothetical protein